MEKTLEEMCGEEIGSAQRKLWELENLFIKTDECYADLYPYLDQFKRMHEEGKYPRLTDEKNQRLRELSKFLDEYSEYEGGPRAVLSTVLDLDDYPLSDESNLTFSAKKIYSYYSKWKEYLDTMHDMSNFELDNAQVEKFFKEQGWENPIIIE